MRKFDLNIERVLEDWEVYHAIREIISNAIDEQLLSKTKEIEIFPDSEEHWHIRDYGRGLRYEHLTQNENKEKLSHPELVIGKFGVGLKDALATFDRHGIPVLLRSRYGRITIGKSGKAGFEDITTLHALIEEPDDPGFIGTDVILDGCSKEDVEQAKNFFLRFSKDKILEKTELGVVLAKGDKARIYINGLRVAEEENFLFSYNITSLTGAMRKALNRERTHVGRTAYTERVKSILMLCKSKEVATLLAADLKEFQTGKIHDELKWIDVAVHCCKLLNSVERVIFLTPDELVGAKEMVDRAINDGYKIVTVPENIKGKIRGQIDVTGAPILDLEQYTIQWNNSFEFKFVDPKDLSSSERRIFEKTEKIANLLGGLPKKVKEIKISETMRLEKFGYGEAVGLWESAQNRIVIKRSELESLQSYAGTLLHEIVHAKTGTNDVSQEFELELTKAIGEVSTISLN